MIYKVTKLYRFFLINPLGIIKVTLLFNLSLVECFNPIVDMLILTAPITIKLSRIIWSIIFVKYNPETKNAK